MKRFLAILLALVMVLSLAACGGKTADDSAPAGDNSAADNSNASEDKGNDASSDSSSGEVRDTLNVAYSSDRGTLDPAYLLGYGSQAAMFCVYDYLWDYDAEGNRIYNVASNFEYVSDTVWRITVKEGITFSNGNPLNAEDVAFSIELGNKREGEPVYFPYMTEAVAIDDYTVEMHLTQFDLSYEYSMGQLPIHDAETYDKEKIALNPVGSGPYKLDEYVVNSHIYLSLRDDYWGEKPAIKNLHFQLITEDSQKTNALQTGALDISEIPSQDVSFIESLGDYKISVTSAGSGGDKTLYFNCIEGNSILANNPDGRKAIAMAIDKEAIADLVYNGYATPSEMGCSARSVDVVDSYLGLGVYGVGYDPDQAKELAEKAGLVGQTLTLSTDGSAATVLMGELIQTDLSAIGINVNIKNYDAGSWSSVYTDPTNCGDMYIDMTNSPSATVAQGISVWYMYGLGMAFMSDACKFENKETMDQLSPIVMSIQDPAERQKTIQQIVDIYTEALLWYNLVDLYTTNAYHKDLQGFQLNMNGNVMFRELKWA